MVTTPGSLATAKFLHLPTAVHGGGPSRPGSSVLGLEKSLHCESLCTCESLLHQGRLVKGTAPGALLPCPKHPYFLQRSLGLWDLTLQPYFFLLRTKPCFW